MSWMENHGDLRMPQFLAAVLGLRCCGVSALNSSGLKSFDTVVGLAFGV